jgi:hypothetical protein
MIKVLTKINIGVFMKKMIAILSLVSISLTTQASILCTDVNKDLEIKISGLDTNADSPIKLDVEIVKNGLTTKLTHSSAVYAGETSQAVIPAPPAHDLKYIISNYMTDSSGQENMHSVWRLKIDTNGTASLTLSGFSPLGVPEYKINCK